MNEKAKAAPLWLCVRGCYAFVVMFLPSSSMGVERFGFFKPIEIHHDLCISSSHPCWIHLIEVPKWYTTHRSWWTCLHKVNRTAHTRKNPNPHKHIFLKQSMFLELVQCSQSGRRVVVVNFCKKHLPLEIYLSNIE